MPLYRCDTCQNEHHEVIPAAPGCFVECRVYRCGGECERVNVCRCGDYDAMDGGDLCVSCVADQIVADPLELTNYNDADQKLIVRELAARLRVVDLTRKQAA